MSTELGLAGIRFLGLAFCTGVLTCALAQSTQTKLEGTSSISWSGGSKAVEIQNVTYDLTSSGIPGRPQNERLLLKKAIHSKEIMGDVGTESTVTLQAWPFGADVHQKPLYTLSETGTAGEIVDADFFVVDRRLEEVAWWSIHKLGTGERLFDTYVPLVSFSLSREIVNMRYAGLQVPPDDAKDKRLTEPHVVAVISYASADKIIREALLTSDDPQRAQLLRSYADSTRVLSDVESLFVAGNKAAQPRHSLRLSIRQNYPSPPNALEVFIPIAGDDLDLANTKLPPGLHLAAWKR